MPPGLIVLTVIAVGVLLALIIAVVRQSSSGSPGARRPSPPSTSSGLSTGPTTTAASQAGAARKAQPTPMPTTSGTGRTLTYLLQAHVPNEGWVVGQKRSGQLSGFGTITATDDELPGFAKAVIQRFDNGTRTMRIVFFRGELSFGEIGIENAYGDVTPGEGGKFSPWIFMG